MRRRSGNACHDSSRHIGPSNSLTPGRARAASQARSIIASTSGTIRRPLPAIRVT
jgi:hypothetical protein